MKFMKIIKKVLFGTGIIIGLAIAAGAVWYAIVPGGVIRAGGAKLPEPTGQYDVGRVRVAVTDANRDEVFTEDPDDKREIVLNFFYPAEVPANAQPVRYTEARGLQLVDGVPALLISPVTPNTYADVPAVEGSYPVVLFSSGWGGSVTYYTTLIEELVSQGYVVVAPEITYNFNAVYFPDGRVVKGNDAGQWEGDYDNEEGRLLVNDVWVKDLSFALDTAEAYNADHPILAGMMDLSRVAAVGHSLGGAASLAAAYHDDRVLAAINFDGRIIDEDLLANGIDKPTMIVFDDFEPPYDYLNDVGMTVANFWEEFQVSNYPPILREGSAPFHVVQVEGVEHQGLYTDLPFLAPMFPFAITEDMIGTIDPAINLEAVSGTTLSFLEAYLNGGTTTNEELANFPALHPGIDMTGWGLQQTNEAP
jgi:dienelactone hydrolase